jgi:Uma2 family endonuclease
MPVAEAIAMTQQLTRELTYEEFVELHAEAEERGGRGYELDEGELIFMTAMDPSQGRTLVLFARKLGNFVEDNDLGEVFFDSFTDMGRRRWYYPDLAYLSHTDLERYNGRTLPVPSTLFVEMSVESSRKRDRERKRGVYHEAGVPWYWIVDLVSEEILEYRWMPADYELVSRTGLYEPFSPQLFPDLTIQLTRLIPRAKPASPES